MRRRDFIRSCGALAIVGLAGAGMRPKPLAAQTQEPDPHAAHQGRALEPAVIDDEFRYRGRHVRVLRRDTGARLRRTAANVQDGALVSLSIDGKEQAHHVFMQAGQGYVSHMLPYSTFRTPRALARSLIDQDGTLFAL